MFQANIRCNLWDLVDEGVPEVLDRLKGEAGATGVCVCISAPPICQVRPHKSVQPRVFRSAGGLQLQPDPELYIGTRIRPAAAAWLRKSNPLASLADACHKRALTLRASINCCHSPAIIERSPTSAVKDVFGDVRAAWLCPVNLDVREYLRSLLQDIESNYACDSIELQSASFPPDRHLSDGESSGVPVDKVSDWLRNLCFCESCRQLATREDIDVTAAARAATVALERYFTAGEPPEPSLDALFASTPILAAYAEWRRDQVADLLRSLHEVSGDQPLIVRASGSADSTGLDLRVLSRHCEGIVSAPASQQPEDVEATVRDLQRAAGSPDWVELDLSACWPACSDAPTLVRAVAEATRLGVRIFNIENYGLMPLSRLDWVKQATRYARREAE